MASVAGCDHDIVRISSSRLEGKESKVDPHSAPTRQVPWTPKSVGAIFEKNGSLLIMSYLSLYDTKRCRTSANTS